MAINSLTSRPARRAYSLQFKAEMAAQCLEGSVALASLAIDHGMNPNMLHRWVTEHERYGKHTLQLTAVGLGQPEDKERLRLEYRVGRFSLRL